MNEQEAVKFLMGHSAGLDAMMHDIVDIFTNIEGVKLVRLSGLYFRELRISNYKELQPQELDAIIHKMKAAGVINYQYITYCPQCWEVSYQLKPKNPTEPKTCDTCGHVYIPTLNESLFETDSINLA